MVGILLGYLFSYIFIDTTGGWRYMFGLAAIPTLVLGAGMVILTGLSESAGISTAMVQAGCRYICILHLGPLLNPNSHPCSFL